MEEKSKRKTLNQWLRIFHRDMGYFIVGVVILYSVSGIAFNHRQSFDSNNKVISSVEIQENSNIVPDSVNAVFVSGLLTKHGRNAENPRFFLRGDNLMVFLENGSLSLNIKTGQGSIVNTKPRLILNRFSFLHRTSQELWRYFSDIVAIFLIIVAITGLFLIKGKNGFKRRGAFLTVAGIIIPIIVIILFFN